MKLGVLFSGGKDSTYAAWLVKKEGHEIACLITVYSKNIESYMFHTPSISKVKIQAEMMGIPLVIGMTAGEKEKELVVLKEMIEEGKIKSVVDKIFPMDQAADAHRRVETEQRLGTIVITMKNSENT